MQGDPGDGKSKLMLSIAALLSKGEALPFTDEETEPMTIIYQTTEDDAEKIIGNNIIDINELRLNNKSFVDAFQIFEKNYNEKESDLCGYCRMTGKLLPAAIQLESNK